MSDGNRIALADAERIGQEVIKRFSGTYQRAMLAGSVRRRKPTVGDIEVVLQTDLNAAGDPVLALCEELYKAGTFLKRQKSNGSNIAWGPRYKAVLFAGFPVDIFIVQKDRQLGPTLLIRTGPDDANRVIVAQRGKGGILPPALRWEDGAIWQNAHQLDTPDEVHVFTACGLPYIEPEARSWKTYLELAGTADAVWKTLPPLALPQQHPLF